MGLLRTGWTRAAPDFGETGAALDVARWCSALRACMALRGSRLCMAEERKSGGVEPRSVRSRWALRLWRLALALVIYGCCAVVTHVLTGKSWGGALSLAVGLAVGWVVTQEFWPPPNLRRRQRRNR